MHLSLLLGVLQYFLHYLHKKHKSFLKQEKGGGIKGMLISMCDCACEDEISEIVSSNDEIRKLRDALNKYLES